MVLRLGIRWDSFRVSVRERVPPVGYLQVGHASAVLDVEGQNASERNALHPLVQIAAAMCGRQQSRVPPPRAGNRNWEWRSCGPRDVAGRAHGDPPCGAGVDDAAGAADGGLAWTWAAAGPRGCPRGAPDTAGRACCWDGDSAAVRSGRATPRGCRDPGPRRGPTASGCRWSRSAPTGRASVCRPDSWAWRDRWSGSVPARGGSGDGRAHPPYGLREVSGE